MLVKSLGQKGTPKRHKRIYPVVYDKAVLDTLTLIWEAINRQCGKLLSPFLRANIDAIAKEPKFNCSAEVIAKLKKISA